jgi:hypothetical protein
MIDSGQTVASGTLYKNAGLYRLNQQTNQGRVYRAVVSYLGNAIQDWHRRFGHINYRYIRKTVEHVHRLKI